MSVGQAGAVQRADGSTGPGSRRVATTLLEWLAARGEAGALERARAALGGHVALDGAGDWLADGTLEALFEAVEVDEGLARALGHRLVTPEATGLGLYGLGLATPEKAYRRVQALLPREAAAGRWQVGAIADRRAQLDYRPAGGGDLGGAATPKRGTPRAAKALCALRRGMLEAVPGLYGWLPASVEEMECVAEGGEACRYVVGWRSAPRWATGIGAAVGLGFALGVLAFRVGFGTLPFVGGAGIAGAAAIALLGCGLAMAFGIIVDQRRQLAAVAGARRGHLALFDQVDDALAARLDALARAEEKLDAAPRASAVARRGPAVDDTGEPASSRGPGGPELLRAVHEIHDAAGELALSLSPEAPEAPGAADAGAAPPDRDAAGALVSEIRAWASRLEEGLRGDGAPLRRPIDLVRLVERAVAVARPTLAGPARISIDAPADLAPYDGEPLALEHAVAELLRNAVTASLELADVAHVKIALAESPRGVELAVEDRGPGIDSTAIDEVFDPFFGERPPGAGRGLGLPVCLRVADRHGGGLHIENQAGGGARVTVLLPRAAHPSPTPASRVDPDGRSTT